MVFPKATPRGVVACGGMTGGVLVEARILGRIELVSGGVRLSLGGTKPCTALCSGLASPSRCELRVSSHIFVDETKRAGYVIAAVTVSDTDAIRTIVRALVLPGQRRIHMKHEQARRRRVIVSALAAMQVQATVYDAARRYRTDLAARTACLTALVDDIAARDGDTRLVIEQDDSVVRADRHDLFQLVRQAGIADRLEYRHQRAYDELLLALPDIVAWSWVRSGEWRRRISPILTTVRTV